MKSVFHAAHCAEGGYDFMVAITCCIIDADMSLFSSVMIIGAPEC